MSLVETEILLKLVLSLALGALVGLEREIHKKPAGLRTHTLVCVGSTLFAVLSVSFGEDPARIAAGVVTGVGFLGAGMIIQAKDKVVGLTTAAELWALAAIGVAAGVGNYFAAVAAAAVVLLVLWPGKMIEIALRRRK